MNKYYVSIPLVGQATFEVTASSEEEAKQIAFDMDVEEADVEYELSLGPFLISRINIAPGHQYSP